MLKFEITWINESGQIDENGLIGMYDDVDIVNIIKSENKYIVKFILNKNLSNNEINKDFDSIKDAQVATYNILNSKEIKGTKIGKN